MATAVKGQTPPVKVGDVVWIGGTLTHVLSVYPSAGLKFYWLYACADCSGEYRSPCLANKTDTLRYKLLRSIK